MDLRRAWFFILDRTAGDDAVTVARRAEQAPGCTVASMRLVRIAEPLWPIAEELPAARYGAGRNAVSRVRSSGQR